MCRKTHLSEVGGCWWGTSGANNSRPQFDVSFMRRRAAASSIQSGAGERREVEQMRHGLIGGAALSANSKERTRTWRCLVAVPTTVPGDRADQEAIRGRLTLSSPRMVSPAVPGWSFSPRSWPTFLTITPPWLSQVQATSGFVGPVRNSRTGAGLPNDDLGDKTNQSAGENIPFPQRDRLDSVLSWMESARHSWHED